jgi:hypothetical protein
MPAERNRLEAGIGRLPMLRDEDPTNVDGWPADE